MQTLIQTFKRFTDVSRWRQWAIVFFAGVLMLVSTACGAAQATVPNPRTNTLPPKAETVTPKPEGMYPYKDTNRDTSAADVKAERMIREAKQRIQQGSDTSLGQRVEDVGQAAQQAAENIGQSTQRAAENAADNARGLVDSAAKTLDQVTPGRG